MVANLLQPLVDEERQVDLLMAAAAYRSHRRRISDSDLRSLPSTAPSLRSHRNGSDRPPRP